MAQISMEVPHSLEKEEVVSRLKGELEDKRDELEQQVKNLEVTWSDDQVAFSFSYFGFKVDGTLVVDDQCVKINATLPLAAKMFQGKIKQTVEDGLRPLLAP